MQTLPRLLSIIALAIGLAACSDSAPPPTEAANPSVTPVTAPSPPSCELVMGWDPWEPYQYEIAGGQVFGLDVDLATAVAGAADCTLTFRKGSWRELLEALEAGEIHLLAGATRTAEREAFARFTTPYRDEAFLLFVPASRLDELTDHDLAGLMADGLRLGVIEDYLYGEPISGYQDNPDHAEQFLYSALAETNIARLVDGEVDGIIEDQYVGAAIIRHKDLGDEIALHPARFTSTAVSFMVSRSAVDEATFERLDASVSELLGSGAIEKVLAQYGNP
ncbi:MAG: transporter substrate-binding domain-containing protein [Pseudomonadota bacterium]